MNDCLLIQGGSKCKVISKKAHVSLREHAEKELQKGQKQDRDVMSEICIKLFVVYIQMEIRNDYSIVE